jgi:toxin ParE1/3/4
MRLVYTDEAQADLINIARHIAERSGHRSVAEDYVRRIRGKCKELAELPFPAGRLRPELRALLRSYAFDNYVIFFIAGDDLMTVVNVIEGHRDIVVMFTS